MTQQNGWRRTAPCGTARHCPARKTRMRGPMVACATVLLLTGCATSSLPEVDLRARHRDAGSLYQTADQGGALPRLDERSTRDDYLRLAFSRNPGLRASFDRWRAALERIPQARTLDDPQLSFEYFIEQMDTRYRVSLTQMFPAWGTLGLRAGKAAAEAEAAMHTFEAERLALFNGVVKAFHEYQYLARATRVTEENLLLLGDLEQAAAARYKTGAAPFSALIKAQVEKDRLASELDSLRDARASRSAALAAWLGLPACDALPWPADVPSGPAILDVSVLDDLIEDLNPELKAAAAAIAAETYGERLARKRLLPDFMLGVDWMSMSGMDESETDVGLMAGISLPLWRGSTRAAVREAGALVQAASRERDNMQNRLKAELSLAVFNLRDAERRIALFESSLIAKAAQSLEVAKQEFSTGKSDFMALIDAQRTLLAFRLMRARAVADREIALGDIGFRIGRTDLGVGP